MRKTITPGKKRRYTRWTKRKGTCWKTGFFWVSFCPFECLFLFDIIVRVIFSSGLSPSHLYKAKKRGKYGGGGVQEIRKKGAIFASFGHVARQTGLTRSWSIDNQVDAIRSAWCPSVATKEASSSIPCQCVCMREREAVLLKMVFSSISDSKERWRDATEKGRRRCEARDFWSFISRCVFFLSLPVAILFIVLTESSHDLIFREIQFWPSILRDSPFFFLVSVSFQHSSAMVYFLTPADPFRMSRNVLFNTKRLLVCV